MGTDALWLSFVEKKEAVKAALIDTGAPIKIIAQVFVVAKVCVAKLKAMRLLHMRRSICNRGKGASVGKERIWMTMVKS